MQALGWRGSQRTVQRYLQPYRAGATMPEPAPAGEATRLKDILARCPELDAAHSHVVEFAAMMRNLRGEQLNDWMQADDLPALHSLVAGLRRDNLPSTTA